MVAVDTNVLVRYMVEDDESQTRLADEFVNNLTESNRGFISREVLLELVWVLDFTYSFPRDRIAKILTLLVRIREFQIENSDEVLEITALYGSASNDFSDLMIRAAAKRVNALPLVTFDKKIARHEDVRLLG